MDLYMNLFCKSPHIRRENCLFIFLVKIASSICRVLYSRANNVSLLGSNNMMKRTSVGVCMMLLMCSWQWV